jgi:uncharacterized damage-inducible protein DinB
MIKKYRKGPVGALMDEYERAALELQNIIKDIAKEDFVLLIDPDTKDSDCRSIQTIMNHVIRAGYGYANYIRKQFGDKWNERKDDYEINSPDAACKQLDKMLKYTVETLENKWDLTFDELLENRIKSSRGQVFDFELLLEHAIVHILRHRRQIEIFLIKIKTAG